MKLTWLLLAAFATVAVTAAEPCGLANGKYDFTKLTENQMEIQDGEYKYTLKLCGTSSQQCPRDKDGVTTGMATQANLPDHCYVLAEYKESYWTEGDESATLTLKNGSPQDCPDGLPRGLEVVLTCDRNQAKADISRTTFTVGETDPCFGRYEISTCLACNEGCREPENIIVQANEEKNATVTPKERGPRYYAVRLMSIGELVFFCSLLVCLCTGMFVAWTWVQRKQESNYVTIGGSEEV